MQAPLSADAQQQQQQLEGLLFVVGDALLDVFADVSREFLNAHNLEFGKAIVADESHKGQAIVHVTRHNFTRKRYFLVSGNDWFDGRRIAAHW